MSLKDDTIEDS